MTTADLIVKIKANLKIAGTESDLIIADAIQEAMNYCNLKELPIEAEPYIRKKIKSIMNYETENGTTAVFDVKSIKEGDTSITYNVDDKVSKETIYGLSEGDKKTLKIFRRLR